MPRYGRDVRAGSQYQKGHRHCRGALLARGHIEPDEPRRQARQAAKCIAQPAIGEIADLIPDARY